MKKELRKLLIKKNGKSKSVYSYGSTAKGNTLLNFCVINSDLVPYCVDSTPLKQGKFLPGSKIEIISEDSMEYDPPDYYLLTAGNYKDEIIRKVRSKRNFSLSFIVPFSNLMIL